jgi:hypothetical protein
MQFRTKLLSSTVLAAAMVLAVPTASAQDIGALEKRVKALEKSGGGKYVTRSKKTVSLLLSGHMYRAIQYRDNGTRAGYVSITPGTSATRVRWIATGKVNDDVTLKSNIEFGLGSAQGNTQALGATGSSPGLQERLVDFSISSKSLGTVSIGQGYPAQAGRYGADLSGTSAASLNGQGARLIVGGEEFQNGGAGVGRTVVDAFNVLDEGRQDRIRYDTPKFQGFQLSADHQNNDDWGFGGQYSASIGGVKINARLGYQNAQQSTADEVSTVNGSLSILLPMGLSLTGSAGDNSANTGTVDDKQSYRYAKIGYKFNGTELGQTRLFVDWHRMDGRNVLGEEANSFSFGVVQIVEPLGAELVLVYHNMDLDLADGTPSDDIDAVTAGIRLSF